MTHPCETCDWNGPELPTYTADARELHRALHGLWHALGIEPVLDRLAGHLTRLLARPRP